MSRNSSFYDKAWIDAPSELWAVCYPNGNMLQSSPNFFATKKFALDYAKKNAQTTDGNFKVYRMVLEGTAVPSESRFIEEAT